MLQIKPEYREMIKEEGLEITERGLKSLPQAWRIRDIEGNASTLQGEAGGQGAKTGLYKVAQSLQTDGQLRQGSSWGTNNPQSSRNIRRLTPLECERLQGFPDGWTKGFSDTQRYKMMGNAVTVNVIEAIMRKFA